MQTYRIALLALLSTLLLYACTKSDDDNTPQQTTYTVNNLNGERMFYGYAITTELDSSVIDSAGVNNYLITINVVNDSTLEIYNLSTYTTGATLKRTTKTYQFRDESVKPSHWYYFEQKSQNGLLYRGLHFDHDKNKCYYYEYVKVPPPTSTNGYVIQMILEEM